MSAKTPFQEEFLNLKSLKNTYEGRIGLSYRSPALPTESESGLAE
jgi:hypothetical protein